MNILFLCQRVPYPPDRGDRITTCNVLAMLRQLGQVRVGCFHENQRDQVAVEKLQAEGLEVAAFPLPPRLKSLPWLLTRQPLTLPCFHANALAWQVEAWRQKGIDLVFCYSSAMAQYVLGNNWHDTRRIMQFAELDSDKWRQLGSASSFPAAWIYKREARRLLPFETMVAKAFDLSLVVSPVERDLFQHWIPGSDPMVVENGVDTTVFAPAENPAREEAIIFTGVMDYQPNVIGVLGFVQECWPLIRAVRPTAKFFIVGSNPAKRIQALNGHDGVQVTGRVPDTQTWFNRAMVAVAPLKVARGIQNKVLEAMSMSLPVVTTSTALAGIDAQAGKHLLVEDETKAFANRIIELLEDEKRARAMGETARRHMEERYSWKSVLAPLREKLAE